MGSNFGLDPNDLHCMNRNIVLNIFFRRSHQDQHNSNWFILDKMEVQYVSLKKSFFHKKNSKTAHRNHLYGNQTTLVVMYGFKLIKGTGS